MHTFAEVYFNSFTIDRAKLLNSVHQILQVSEPNHKMQLFTYFFLSFKDLHIFHPFIFISISTLFLLSKPISYFILNFNTNTLFTLTHLPPKQNYSTLSHSMFVLLYDNRANIFKKYQINTGE